MFDVICHRRRAAPDLELKIFIIRGGRNGKIAMKTDVPAA